MKLTTRPRDYSEWFTDCMERDRQRYFARKHRVNRAARRALRAKAKKVRLK